MRLPKYFWAFNFELNNSHLFQQETYTSLTRQRRHCDVILVIMFLQTVLKLLINSFK